MCERNYARVLQLLPDRDLQKGNEMRLWLGEHEYRLKVLENAPYTSVLQLTCYHERPWLAPQMRIVLYHDARMAEVCASQQISHPKGRYNYPNRQMFQQDEKFQANRLLAEWLSLCLELGRLDEAIFSGPAPDK